MGRPEEAHFISGEQLRFSGKGFLLEPHLVDIPQEHRHSPIVAQMHQPWNLENYQVPRSFLVVCDVPQTDRAFFGSPCLTIPTMPIKIPDGDQFKIPSEFSQFKSTMQMIIDHQAGINSRWKEYYAYINVDQRSTEKGRSQRKPGTHVDGAQFDKDSNPYPNTCFPELEYTVSNALPTTFFPGQKIDFSDMDTSAPDALAQFNRLLVAQVDRSSAVAGDPYSVYFFDPYVPHEATVAQQATERTFFKMFFSQRRLVSSGFNSVPLVNPLLPDF